MALSVIEERIFTFTAPLWIWQSETATAWHFVSLPKDAASAIKFFFPRKGAGFGSIRVSVTLGGSQWKTSIFPHAKSETFVLPIKATIRKAENIVDGDECAVKIEII